MTENRGEFMSAKRLALIGLAVALMVVSAKISVPFVPKTGIMCRSEAYLTSSRISGRIKGSPPEKIMILKPALAISERSFLPSSVLSSSSALQPASR